MNGSRALVIYSGTFYYPRRSDPFRGLLLSTCPMYQLRIGGGIRTQATVLGVTSHRFVLPRRRDSKFRFSRLRRLLLESGYRQLSVVSVLLLSSTRTKRRAL
ncbi:hypothetical protein K438DRAFT_1862572 [Mycena galopus ATCC 62051]|nr:hypothetical protein K438DRAFT_1862572 [Mycena galopus ATCC 62051]